jgi:hypothetical protein
LQKTVNEYINADEEGRKKIVSGLEFSMKEYRQKWEEAINNNDAKNRAHWALQMDYTQEALGEIGKLHEESVVIVEQTEEEKRAAWDKTQAKIRETAELSQMVTDNMRKSLQDALSTPPDKKTNPFADYRKGELPEVEAEESIADLIDTEAIADKFNEMREMSAQFVADMNQMLGDFVADFVGAFAEGMAGLMTSDIGLSEFFNHMLGMFGEFIVQFGKMLVGYGIAFEAFQKAPGPLKIIAGIALIGIGKAISNMAAKGVSGGGGGGGSATGYGGGGSSYANSVSGYGNTAENGYMLSTDISGDNLRIIMQRAERNATRRV